MTLTDRFWRKVAKGSADECWRWTGCHNSRGYGCVGIAGKVLLVHRVAYEAMVGPIPDGFTIDHVRARGCQHKDCVNPAHLEAVTSAENTARAHEYVAPCRHGVPRTYRKHKVVSGAPCPECEAAGTSLADLMNALLADLNEQIDKSHAAA